mgnify:CR=1 FL=1
MNNLEKIVEKWNRQKELLEDEIENLKIQNQQLKNFGVEQVTMNNKMSLWQKELLLSHDKLEEIIKNLKQEIFKMTCKRNLAQSLCDKQIYVNEYQKNQIIDYKKDVEDLRQENEEMKAYCALVDKMNLDQ